MFKNKKVIIFDMDGTLIDSIGCWNEIDKMLIKRLGYLEEISNTEIQARRDKCLSEYSKMENPYLEYSKTLGKMYNSTLSGEEIIDIRHQIAEDYLINMTDYKPSADLFIKKLKEKGFILVIASTTRKRNIELYKTKNQTMIQKANIDDYFSKVYTREDVKEIKPNPEVYLKVLKELNIEKEECLIFEDSLVGIEAAKKAGIEVVAMYDKYSDLDRNEINKLSDYQINNYSEAIKILENLK